MQSLFQQNVSLNLRLLIIAILCIALMTIDHRQQALDGVRTFLNSYLVYPLQYLTTLPIRLTDNASTALASRTNLLRNNADLHQENLHLKAEQLKLISLQQENERLRDLLRSSTLVGEDILIAEVITVDQDFYKQQIVINKGSKHNLYIGQPVIDATGVMGQVAELNQYSATVLLISDPGHALPVQSNRNGIRTVAQGKGNPNELDLLYIPNNVDMQVGDLMITSGLGGRFPANYPVAKISEVKLEPGKPFAAVVATPTALLDRSREVLLVWPNTDEPQQPLNDNDQ